jgi:hypothetical protein
MRRKDFITAALIAFLTDPAFADLQGAPAGPPVFTRNETVIIDRNATLSELAKSNPWIVRKLFDAVEKAASSQSDGQTSPPPADENDADPELDQLKRASPEAVHDLFQLLKQAGEKKADKPK